MKSPSPTRVFLVTAIAVVAFLLWQVARGPRSLLLGFSWAKQHRFETMQIGASKATVLGELGSPRHASHTCNLPQRQGFEEAFRRAEQSGAVEFLLWNNGGNWFYCVGFDTHGQLVFAGEGHS